MSLLLLLIGGLVVLALQPRNTLEAGSGMGNEKFPLGNGQSNSGSPAAGGTTPSISVTPNPNVLPGTSGGTSPGVSLTVNPSILPGLSISTPIADDTGSNDTTTSGLP